MAASSRSLEWEIFAAAADRIAPRFAESVAPIHELVDSSILFSDGLCVAALCQLFQITVLLEAGTGFGGSTEMLARYFQHTGASTRIVSIDQAVNPRWQRLLGGLRLKRYGRHVWASDKHARRIATERLASYRHVSLLRGDALVELPKIGAILAAEGERIGVVLDGPKGDDQLRLAEQMLALSPQVLFAALDDVGPLFEPEQRHSRFLASPRAVFVTSDRRFFDRYGWINAGRLPARMIGKPDHTGYGMGVMV